MTAARRAVHFFRPAGRLPGLAVLLCAWLALLPVPTCGVAQQVDRQELEAAVREISSAWELGEMGAVADRMRDGGVLLHLPEAVHPALSIRMARAALQELHARAGTGEVAVDRVRALGGIPARASLELVWNPVPPGMTSPMTYTVFMGLERGSGTWRIAEVRVLGGKLPSPSTTRASP